MEELTWTQDSPVVAGYYYFADRLGYTWLVDLVRVEEGGWVYYFGTEDSRTTKNCNGCMWCGPIVVQPPPSPE